MWSVLKILFLVLFVIMSIVYYVGICFTIFEETHDEKKNRREDEKIKREKLNNQIPKRHTS